MCAYFLEAESDLLIDLLVVADGKALHYTGPLVKTAVVPYVFEGAVVGSESLPLTTWRVRVIRELVFVSNSVSC